MSKPIEIDSDYIIEKFDSHFRVFAGPGAGKTHWLINNIKNVAKKSEKVSSSRRIVCITYTNVATNEIKERLEEYIDKVDVSTIHSFLYRYVVKPYLHVIVDSQGKPLVDFVRVDGHDEHRQRYDVVSDWIKGLGGNGTIIFRQKSRFTSLKKNINRIAWELEDGTLNAILRPKKYIDYITRPFKDNLESYKNIYWEKGIIDHEDVLYFAYRILDENPKLRDFLALKFPYVYVDEFQDTNPIQTQIIKWLGKTGSHIGIIGDIEQSIYSFQGAHPEDFTNFNLSGIRDYKISGNRRSTVKIIKVLDNIRSDEIRQEDSTTENIEGLPVEIHTGNLSTILNNISQKIEGELAVLARSNNEVISIRKEKYTEDSAEDKWQEFRNNDSDRARFIETIIMSIELFRKNQCTESLKKLCKLFEPKRDGKYKKPLKCSVRVSKIQSRGIALSIINQMIDKYDDINNKKLFDCYRFLSDIITGCIPKMSLSKISSGAIREYAETTIMADLINSVSLPGNETRNIRTIHQAKGAQFDNVLLSLNHIEKNKASKQLDLLLDGSSDEEKRILYVAMSRAKKRLFISIPELTEAQKAKATKMGIKVVEKSKGYLF